MTAQTIRDKYRVNVMKFGWTAKTSKWVAFKGGNGTGEPVVEIAEAYHLVELERRVKKATPAEVQS